MIEEQRVFIFGDQLTMCPFCGSRSEILLDLFHTLKQTQLHQCPNLTCGSQFIMIKDEELETELI